jgi:hypothetical protein
MNRNFMRWFYTVVQFVMLATSIPKVFTLFHAYDPHTELLIAGIDVTSWCMGVAIDLTATFTSWTAMAKYEETRQRSALLAPAVIILFCSTVSVLANYEDAATIRPEQYAHVTLFTQSAWLINPIVISAPPILVLLLILLVPNVLARGRIKTAAEIEAETASEAAKLKAKAQLDLIRTRNAAELRGARISGLADNASVIAKRVGITQDSASETLLPEPEEKGGDNLSPSFDPSASAILEAPSANVSRAMWNSMSLKDRVIKSGLITTKEVAEVLAISEAHARKLAAEVRASSEDAPAVPGRTGVPYQTLIDALYTRKTSESFAQAQKLEKALGLRKRNRQGADSDNATHPDHSGRTGGTVEYRPDGGLGAGAQAEDQVGENWEDSAYSHNGHSGVRPAAD